MGSLGSVLGPLLFISFTEYLGENLENQIVSYDKDTTLFAYISNHNDRISTLFQVFVVIHYCVMAADRDNNTATYLINIMVRYEDLLLSLSAAITL